MCFHLSIRRVSSVKTQPYCPHNKRPNKIHKDDAPIRPIVNWKNAPAYKLAKMLSDHFNSQ